MQEPFSQQHQPNQEDKPSQESRRDSSQIHDGIESHLQPLMNYQERVEVTKQRLTILSQESTSFETLNLGRIRLRDSGGTIIISGKSLEGITTAGFLTIGNNTEISSILLENALLARASGKQLSMKDQSHLDAFDAANRELALTERICGELIRSEHLNNMQ